MNALQLAERVVRNLVDASGALTPLRAAAQVYETATLRTQLLPEVTVSMAQAGEEQPAPKPSLLGVLLRPAVELRGPAGVKVLAPYGEPEAHLRALNLTLLVGVVLGVPFFAGLLLGKHLEPTAANPRTD